MVETVGRVFAAVPLPAETRLALVERLAGVDIPGKRVPPENWHLSLRFLGSIDGVTYERFLHGLEDAQEVSPFQVEIDGIEGFPRANKASVVWVGVTKGREGLADLNAIAETAAETAGLDAEERPFRPHLTLARVRPPEDVRDLADHSLQFSWAVGEIVVYQSHLGKGGARYEPLESFALNG